MLLYTSGSTGVPKGVMIEHQNIVAFTDWYREYYELKPEHNVAAYASFGFDANMMDLYPTLTTGATVHIIPEEIRLDLVALNDYFEANNITHGLITTQVGVQFMQNTDNHSLKHLSVGGEKLVSVDPPKGYTFHNAYGPTECTIISTIMPVKKREANIPIGKPTSMLKCYVMDKQMHRLPVGAAGELIIVGKQVGRGYLNRPDKTAEAFFTMDGERAYHSGDIVRYRKDGKIEFVGRRDGQVKIRGFRIELKEVETVIRDFEGIKDVTVQAFDDANGGKFIAAYIVSDDTIDIEALNDFILDQKPPYMVPAVTMQIEKIPLNVNQKVDKKALPKPERQAPTNEGTATANAPLNAFEKELKAIIASVVNTEDFGITDVLGFVGLTSISGIKLATLIYKKYGVQINAKTLAKTGTLQSIENEILIHWMEGRNENKNETLRYED
ncbi:MAG: non-ribosomal peptide synthetase, partial [Prevotellaceae bacterium]|nr:non-ribosomal peptide synthetase [Prevotellaceae bacterium]